MSERFPGIDEARRRSIDRLKGNACKHGFLASPVDRRNYRALWARDGCISAAAACLCGDEELAEAGRHTLHTLARHQADNGQVPSYLAFDSDDGIAEVNYGGWGEITSIDSSLWFMIACQTVFRGASEQEFGGNPLFRTYREVIGYLMATDANSCGLLEIPLAGDWTDVFNRSYHVLYDQVLWYGALRSAAELARHESEKGRAEFYSQAAGKVRRRLNEDFWWDDWKTVQRVADKYKIRNDLPRHPDLRFYQSHLEPFLNNWFNRFEALGNVLAALMGIATPERTAAIVRRVFDSGLDRPFPLRVLDPPIEESDPDAHQLRISEEPPYAYHNGGIWPLAGGFWVVLLARVGRSEEAFKALQRLALSLSLPRGEWGFHEYFHGQSFEPKGTRSLSWNAAAYLLAHHAVIEQRFPDFVRPDGKS